MVRTPKVGARKIVDVRAVALSGPPAIVGRPPTAAEAAAGQTEPVAVVVPMVNKVGLVARADDGTVWFRTQETPWTQVPGLDDEVEIDDAELARLRAELEGRGG